MMQSYYKTILLLLTSISFAFGQRKTVYNQSFETDKETTAIFNFDNSTVGIIASNDGKIHFDYVIEFDGYSKKEIEEKISEIDVNASKFDNHITLVAKSNSKIHEISYAIDTPDALVLDFDFSASKSDEKYRKSKDSIIREIVGKRPLGKLSGIKYLENHFKIKDENGKLKKVRKAGLKILRSLFVIRIPPFVKLQINGKDSQINVNEDFTNELSLDIKQGAFKAKRLTNAYNNITLDNAKFQVYGILGGNYNFNTLSNGLVGSIENAKITSEFSKMEVGEIGENVTINDFNSEYWFYNWQKTFERFDLFSEYSKIHFFYPETYDFKFKVIGNNTVNHFNDVSVNMQPSRTGEKFNMLERKPKNEGHFSGDINFDVVHGIIYSYNDTFEPKTSN
ncbi:MAG: hypothetical protein AAF688_01890 [Bacteroidota bacterium]